MKNLKVFLMTLSVMVFSIVAQIGASSACHFNWYQPEVPKSLQKY